MSRSLKIIFFGTPLFAAKVFSYLLEQGVHIVAVVTRPDKPKGRSGALIPSPVKERVLSCSPSIPVFQPEKASDPQFEALLAPFEADLFVVVAYGEIMKQHLLDLPKKGCINLHASLLPKLRGAAPIQRAIMEGEKETGITIMHMVRKMDAGGMIYQATVPIGREDTFEEVETALCVRGAPLLYQTILDFENGEVTETPQEESQVTFAPKVELEDCQIDWNLPASMIHNLVRGVYPSPCAWCWISVKGELKRLRVLKSRLNSELLSSNEANKTGDILSCSKEGMQVVCGEGILLLLQLQLEGKRAMSADECYRGTIFHFAKSS